MCNSTTVANNIKILAKTRKISLKTLFEECGMGRNAMSHMTNGSMPKGDNLAKIADYLGCSVDYLLGRETAPHLSNTGDITNTNGVIGHVNAPVSIGNGQIQPQTLTTQEQDLLRIYKNATTRQQIKLMDFALSIEKEVKECNK